MLICSVALVSISAAAITSALTLSHSQLANKTSLLEDLQGESVAIISGTEVDRYARNLDANIVTKDTMEQAFEALRNDEVAAVIADKLLARDYLYKHKPQGVSARQRPDRIRKALYRGTADPGPQRRQGYRAAGPV